MPSTVAYRLGILGTIAANSFSAEIESLNLKPKQVGLLVALDHDVAASQQELAARLGVVPSLVVSLADQLEQRGAVRRERDPADRRRQILTLTDRGRELLDQAAQAAEQVDRALTARLTAAQLGALHEALAVLATDAGLPGA
ncbi:MarR family transcriptional regulator [Nocardia stercoris]|uniref:MarR family transcriptional regulator n=1 Tax=Nocardia stercoris TaxID=2483361 RepID=A0A3M2KWW1_9NOCA|nr:MarR family transcriptional regulator [Nocardia stercoris]